MKTMTYYTEESNSETWHIDNLSCNLESVSGFIFHSLFGHSLMFSTVKNVRRLAG